VVATGRRHDRVERLGLFGGTFDPIHVGHLVAAVNVRHTLALDRVLLVVANQPWQKVGSRLISAAVDRLALVQAAVEGLDGIEASSIEIERGGPSYSVDTVEELTATQPDAELFLIVGADAADELRTWERVERLRGLVTLVVVNRPGCPDGDPGAGWRTARVDIPGLEISSSDLRDRVASGRPLDFLVPPPVVRRIKELGLYAGRG
jgi:nicotinate-nucleotide adenylyltransferase